MNEFKRKKALIWVHGYAATGAAVVIAAIIPGSTSAGLLLLEGTMAFHIGKIYKVHFTREDGIAVAQKVGLAAVLGKIVALEALNFVPFAGWAVKAPIALGVIEILGREIIAHFESFED